MPRLQRSPKSLRAKGKVVLATDKPTREALRSLAGDGNMSDVLRELVNKAMKERNLPMPDMGRAASTVSLSAISDSLKDLGNRINRLEAQIVVAMGIAHWDYGAAGNITGATRNDYTEDAPHGVINYSFKAARQRVKQELEGQAELNLNEA